MKSNITVQSYRDIVDRDRTTDQMKMPDRTDTDIATLTYNRGSFKIVIHTEANLIAKLSSYTEVFKLSPEDRHISYLDVS